jgi:hypothetical protein
MNVMNHGIVEATCNIEKVQNDRVPSLNRKVEFNEINKLLDALFINKIMARKLIQVLSLQGIFAFCRSLTILA